MADEENEMIDEENNQDFDVSEIIDCYIYKTGAEDFNNDCLFCKIIEGTIPSTKVYESNSVLAFKDITPQAPVHILVVPKIHIESVDTIGDKYIGLVMKIFQAIPKIAAEQGLTKGYRVVSNVGEHGAQSVKHLHFHILGGEQLSGKMC